MERSIAGQFLWRRRPGHLAEAGGGKLALRVHVHHTAAQAAQLCKQWTDITDSVPLLHHAAAQAA